VDLLDNPVRAYAWGSRTVIADLLGEEVPSPHPQAELWFGAHPADPSHLVHADGRRSSLLDALSADPVGLLGADRSGRWDATSTVMPPSATTGTPTTSPS
jgi:mannose-6-phosphate isomerase